MKFMPEESVSSWKDTVYQSYVSSGHVPDAGNSAEEYFRGRRAFFEAIIRSHFPSDRAARILDIGCGHGALPYFLYRAGYSNVRGVDGSREQVELARRLGITGVEYGEALGFLHNFENASAEAICLFDVLEHLTRQEAFDLLEEVRRVLSPGGRCIGHVPNAAGIFGSRIRYGDLSHEQAFTASSLSQMFRSLGFSEVRCFEDKPIVHGATSAVRRILWQLGTVPFRLLSAAETGSFGVILSQNVLFVAHL